MTTYNRAQALARAMKSTTYPVGMCYRWTREMFGLPAVGDRDGDGDADAVDGWKAAERRHGLNTAPPAGVPMFWSGGSRGHGHAAISAGDGRVRSIDAPIKGRVGTVPMDWFRQHWGLTYLGWSEDLGGEIIPRHASKGVDIIYNLKAHRGAAAGRDVARIVAETRPGILALQETAGNRIAVWRATRKVYRRPITGKGADGASTWLLIRKDIKVKRTRLIVAKRVWRGPKGRIRLGRTLPLAVVWQHGEWECVIAGHLPTGTERNAPAYNETMARLEAVGRRVKMPLRILCDWNKAASKTGPHTPQALAKAIGGDVVRTPGAPVDYLVVRGLRATCELLRHLRGGTDHPGPVKVTHTKESK